MADAKNFPKIVAKACGSKKKFGQGFLEARCVKGMKKTKIYRIY